MSFTRKSSGEDAGLYDTSDGDLKAATVHYVYAHTRRHRGSPLTHGLQTFWERIPRRARLWIRLLLWLAILVSTLITIPSVFLAVSEPRYTSQPERYRWLSKQIRESLSPGAGNLKAEKIFIATNVNSARLIQGAWGKDVKHLVHILGPENVFLSLYVDDVDEDTATALRSWGMGLHCEPADGVPCDYPDTDTSPQAMRQFSSNPSSFMAAPTAPVDGVTRRACKRIESGGAISPYDLWTLHSPPRTHKPAWCKPTRSSTRFSVLTTSTSVLCPPSISCSPPTRTTSRAGRMQQHAHWILGLPRTCSQGPQYATLMGIA